MTALSQSPNIRVLSTDRVVAILERAGQLDQQITSSEVIREVAQRGGVQNVLLGSFMKVGETIRITIRLQDADSGSILASEMAEGEGESSIFPLVDDLTNRIKNTFEIPQAAEMELNRDIEDVTTASLEAYRQYAEGIRLKDEGQEREAIPWLERAVEIDPNFAMAYAKLSVIHGNNSRLTESEDYAQKAWTTPTACRPENATTLRGSTTVRLPEAHPVRSRPICVYWSSTRITQRLDTTWGYSTSSSTGWMRPSSNMNGSCRTTILPS